MIKLNGVEISLSTFPDGTSSFRIPPMLSSRCFLEWKYDGDYECMAIWHIAKHVKAQEIVRSLTLVLPYIPNARMDRVKNQDEVFTLKHFAEFINTLEFNHVIVHDPHSNVSTALIDRVIVDDIRPFILEAIRRAGDDVILCYPDEGAAKRYSEMVEHEYVFCVKHRDWATRDIVGLELIGGERVAGKNVMIVDDICSSGETSMHTAKVLKGFGANYVSLYVTHCENTIANGDVLDGKLISKVYTTGSIYRGEHEKVSVIKRGDVTNRQTM